MILDIRKHNNQHGFSLVELALVFMISGFTMLMAAKLTKVYTTSAQHEKTIEHLDFANGAIKEFVALNGFYPCPADPSLGPGNALYGISQCRDFTLDTSDCTQNAAGNIVCINNLSRDGNSDGFLDVVTEGIIPFRTLIDGVMSTPNGDRPVTKISITPFTEAYRVDGHGTLLTYAVTEHMTDHITHGLGNRINPYTGAISILDENLIDNTIIPGSAHYALFSNGDNAVGGYTKTGALIENCFVNAITGLPDASPPAGPPGGGAIKLDRENCDQNDAIYIQGIRSLADNSNYYDDLLYYQATGLVPIWETNISSPIGENFIYNTNTGFVGVGTDLPEQQLHVVGDLSAEGLAMAQTYCNEVGDDCFDPDTIAGDLYEMQCADVGDTPGTPNILEKEQTSRVAYGIHNNQLLCHDIDWTPPAKSCPPTAGAQPRFLRGISNTGNIYCCDNTGANCCRTEGGTACNPV